MMKNKILLLLSLTLLISSCSGETTKPEPDKDDDQTQTPVEPDDKPITPDEPIEPPKEKTLFDELKDLKDAKVNYTLDVVDYGGDFRQVYYPNSYSITFDGESYTQNFVEDENGIFDLTTYSEERDSKVGFYYVDENNENIKSLYENLFYTFKDLTLDEKEYELTNDKLLLKDPYCADAIVLFNLCGYSTSNTYPGMQLTDVKEMYFTKSADGFFTFNMVFNELTSERGTTTCTVCNIGKSVQDEKVTSFLKEGKTGKFRLSVDDKMYTYLANLKNLRNYTIKVRGDYQNPAANYTYEAKYMSYAFYGTSSFEGQEDEGYIFEDKKIYRLLYDGISEQVVKGDHIPSYDGKDLYLDMLFSFATTKWNPYDFKATIENDQYVIYETDYLVSLAEMVNNTFMLFQLQTATISYDETENEYHFIMNLYGGDKIHIDVVDINKTSIYNLIEK